MTADPVSGRAAVAGIGQTTYAKNLGRTELDLACEAIIAACADAGFPVREVDGLVSYSIEQVVRGRPRHHTRPRERVVHGPHDVGGGGAAAVAGMAAIAVASGQAESVIAFRSRNRSKGASYGADPNQGGRPWEKVGAGVSDGRQWHNPFGVAHRRRRWRSSPAGTWRCSAPPPSSSACRRWRSASTRRAIRNAIMREAITLDDWRRRAIIADPIRLVDCSLENDGATAILFTTIERGARPRQPPAVVLAQAMGAGPIHVALADYFRTSSSFGGRDHGGRHIATQLSHAPASSRAMSTSR